jgi:subfamily B ATP-binding cassette protein MsbA
MKQKKLKITYLLRPYWKRLTIAFVAVLVESGMDLLEPWPLKVVLDHVLGKKAIAPWLASIVGSTVGRDSAAVLTFAAIAVILIAAVGAISSYTENYLTTSVGQWIMHDLRSTVYHHIQRLSLAYYDRQQTGDLISRVTGDIDAIQDFISSALLGILVDILTLLGMLGVMFYLDWRFTLLALSVTPVLFVVVYSFTRRIKKASRQVRKKEGEIISTIQEVFTSIRVVKAFASEDYEQKRLERESLQSVEIALRARGMKAMLSPVVQIIVAAGTCLVLWYGARLVLAGVLTTGALVVFLLYLGKMYKPMRDLSKMADTASKAAVGFERIKEILETDRQVKNLPGSRRAPNFRGKIEFINVSFEYDRNRPALRDVSLKIEPGQLAAFVGPTGAGKSTIIGLIPRFYDPTSGQIRIDGFDVRRFKIKSLRQQISFVLQDTVLFRAPVWQNIAYGRPEAAHAEIVRAAQLANAHEFIEKLASGYDTMVGERGVTLSGGQRQRIAIARAVIRNSPVLIMDEPTSGLDASSEMLVIEALGRLMEGKTSIIIAHRLSTIRNADVIFVVSEGRIVERGSHADLLAAGGLYSELHDTQFKAQEAESAVLSLES